MIYLISLDAEWQIDIKKSIARPPLILREQLKAYAGQVRNQAVEVYRHKGKNVKMLPVKNLFHFGLIIKEGTSGFIKSIRDHPLVEKIKNQAIIRSQIKQLKH